VYCSVIVLTVFESSAASSADAVAMAFLWAVVSLSDVPEAHTLSASSAFTQSLQGITKVFIGLFFELQLQNVAAVIAIRTNSAYFFISFNFKG
jgi:hypothetical protein